MADDRAAELKKGLVSSASAGRQGRLEEELRRLERIPLVVVDEVGYG
jgi:hypothetical protein